MGYESIKTLSLSLSTRYLANFFLLSGREAVTWRVIRNIKFASGDDVRATGTARFFSPSRLTPLHSPTVVERNGANRTTVLEATEQWIETFSVTGKSAFTRTSWRKRSSNARCYRDQTRSLAFLMDVYGCGLPCSREPDPSKIVAVSYSLFSFSFYIRAAPLSFDDTPFDSRYNVSMYHRAKTHASRFIYLFFSLFLETFDSTFPPLKWTKEMSRASIPLLSETERERDAYLVSLSINEV